LNTIGVDIGGTKVKAGIIDQDGRLLSHVEEKTNKQDLKTQLLSLIECLLKQRTCEIEGIGIATAGRVNVEKGLIHYATSNLPGWTGTRVRELVEERFQLPAVVDNDANCAAYAEMEIGSATQAQHFICITLGTGIGAGIILNGELHRGENGGAGEIGHMIFVPNGRPCNCGKKGCWEQYVSGTALSLDIKEQGALLKQNIRPDELFKLANENHPIAVQIVDRFITNLAIGVVSLQNVLDVNCFVVGGGVINSSQYWWNELLTKLKAVTDQPPIVRKAMLKNDAGMLGAALMARKYATIQKIL
jgi:glucokinase